MTHLGAVESIGNTPLVQLRRIPDPGGAQVLIKLESQNPTGSLKDRMALAVVDVAVAAGKLRPGGRLVEYSGGNTGTALAFVCAARGIPATVVSSDAFSADKLNHMRALGAEVVEISSDQGRITRDLIQAMIARAQELSAEPGAFYADQFNNPDARGGYATMAQEIARQCVGAVDVFVHSVGTGQSIAGVGGELRRLVPDVRIVAVEPAESPVLSGGQPGAHRIEGIGAGFIPPLWEPTHADAFANVSTDEAKAMCRRLAREEGLFLGTSSGANVVAALREAAALGPEQIVVTLGCDSGMKYLATDVYASH